MASAGNATTSGGMAGSPEATGGSPGGAISTAGADSGTETGGRPPAVCGDGVADLGEPCDGEDFGSWTCEAIGFDTGELACTQDCELVTTDCDGTETCFDFRDNDGDGLVDCADDACEDVCADACNDPPLLDDPVVVDGTTEGRPSELGACGAASTGPALVYRLAAAHTGLLRVNVVSSQSLTVSLRTDCSDASTELGCAFSQQLEREVGEGDELFVVVEGLTSADAGEFLLEVASREIACGDGYRDADEECDDGNDSDDDGCSSDCTLEPTEMEDNGSMEEANRYAEPFYGAIDALGDTDWVRFDVESSPSALAIATHDLGDGACALGLLDSALQVVTADGEILVENDDGGEGRCAKIIWSDLTAGIYYARVTASPSGSTATFPYLLSIDVDACGNGRHAEGEECDDGNRIPWDGCDEDCKRE